jgi:hypothetical protein
MGWVKAGVLLGPIVFAMAAVPIFWVSFMVIHKIPPYTPWDEIVERQSQALAFVVTAMSVRICIILAADIRRFLYLNVHNFKQKPRPLNCTQT